MQVLFANLDVMNIIAHELFQELLEEYIRQVKLGAPTYHCSDQEEKNGPSVKSSGCGTRIHM